MLIGISLTVNIDMFDKIINIENMKKHLLIVVTSFVTTYSIAQDKDAHAQKFQINFGSDSFRNLKNSYFGFDYKIDDEVSIGLNASWSGSLNNLYSNGYNDRGAIFSFHTNFDWAKKIGLNTNKFDIYTGFNTGRATVWSTAYNTSEKISNSAFTVGGQFGLRYFFTKNIGINAEINGGVINNNPIRAGLSIKF